ncbi:hypothetical protein ACGFSG_36055 [Streptomyces sp. NPDC048512]
MPLHRPSDLVQGEVVRFAVQVVKMNDYSDAEHDVLFVIKTRARAARR